MELQRSLAEIPSEFKEIYKQHWHTITGTRSGMIKDVYHFPLITETDIEIESKIRRILLRYRRSVKLNVSFGFILMEVDQGQMKFFHPSNNNKVFENPKRISGETDIKALLEDVEYKDALEYAIRQRPSTKWRPVRIICLRLDIFKS